MKIPDLAGKRLCAAARLLEAFCNVYIPFEALCKAFGQQLLIGHKIAEALLQVVGHGALS